MAIATALLGFNDLGRSGTPTFLFRNRFYLQLTIISTLFKNEQKINVGSKKNFKISLPGHGILPSCGCKARETST